MSLGSNHLNLFSLSLLILIINIQLSVLGLLDLSLPVLLCFKI